MNRDWHVHVLLGSGGGKRGTCQIYDGGSNHPSTVFTLSHRDSIYAIDRSRDAVLLATKHGDLYFHRGPYCGEPVSFAKVAFNERMLDVCFTQNEIIVYASEAQVCWLRHKHRLEDPRNPLTGYEGVICGIVASGNKDVFGISDTGQLARWLLPHEKAVSVTDGPQPPEKRAAVKLWYWQHFESTVYPGEDGSLVVNSIHSTEQRCIPAHQGVWYAGFPCFEWFVTIGYDDGLIKVWEGNELKLLKAYAGPKSMIAATGIDDELKQILLVSEDGRATVLQRKGDRFHCLQTWEGGFRCVAGPDFTLLRHQREQRYFTRSEVLEAEIENILNAGREYEQLPSKFRELREIGYQDVALTLEARLARFQADELGELRCLHALFQCCDDIGDDSTRESYTTLLKRFWLHREIPELIGQRRPDIDQREAAYFDLGWRNGIDDIDEELVKITQAADIVGTPPSGAFIWYSSTENDLVSFPEARLAVDEVSETLIQAGEASNFPIRSEKAVIQSSDESQEKVLLEVMSGTREDSVILGAVLDLDQRFGKLCLKICYLARFSENGNPISTEMNMAADLSRLLRHPAYHSWRKELREFVIGSIRKQMRRQASETSRNQFQF